LIDLAVPAAAPPIDGVAAAIRDGGLMGKAKWSVIFYLSSVLLIFAFSPQVVWSASTDADRAIALSQQKIRRSPNNSLGYFLLGDAYIQKARESGDPTYFELAEKALKNSLRLNPSQSGARRHLAHLMAMRHDFAAAATEAETAIAADPGDADAYAVLGDAYLEMGKFDQAERAYERMVSLRKSLASYSRLSGLKSLRGDHQGAVSDLKKAIQLGQEQKQPSESIAWAQWQLGSDYHALSKLKDAEDSYRQSLVTYPNYYRALAGMAQVRAAQKKYAEAIQLYQRAIAVLPLPEYAAALGDIYAKTGQQEKAKQQYDLVEYIGKLSKLNQALYNRELAYFYADHDLKLTEALELARRELDYRRDIYAYDLLAWTLYKNGNTDDACDAIQRALRLGTQDAKLFYHAGMIYRAAGEREKAAEFLSRALATNPYFHPLFADTAERVLNQLEDEIERESVALRK
jgi:tetratricopeptide (TPR) repeat protein